MSNRQSPGTRGEKYRHKELEVGNWFQYCISIQVIIFQKLSMQGGSKLNTSENPNGIVGIFFLHCCLGNDLNIRVLQYFKDSVLLISGLFISKENFTVIWVIVLYMLCSIFLWMFSNGFFILVMSSLMWCA